MTMTTTVSMHVSIGAPSLYCTGNNPSRGVELGEASHTTNNCPDNLDSLEDTAWLKCCKTLDRCDWDKDASQNLSPSLTCSQEAPSMPPVTQSLHVCLIMMQQLAGGMTQLQYTHASHSMSHSSFEI